MEDYERVEVEIMSAKIWGTYVPQTGLRALHRLSSLILIVIIWTCIIFIFFSSFFNYYFKGELQRLIKVWSLMQNHAMRKPKMQI